MGIAREAARRVVKDYMLGHELPGIYREAAKEPADPRKVLFVNVKLANMPEAFKVIMPYLEERYALTLKFVGLNQAGTGFKSYHARCRDLVREIATASYVFLEDASDVVSCLPLRPETKVIQLWHGCGAFKKWGRSTATKKFGPSAAQIERHPFYGNLSLVTVSAPEVEWAYREAMGLDDLGVSHQGEPVTSSEVPGNDALKCVGRTEMSNRLGSRSFGGTGNAPVVRALGVSRTDVFFDQEFLEGARDRLLAAHPQIGNRKVLLYAPTFRGAVKQAKGPDALDVRAMREALEEGWVLAIRHHPFVKEPPAIPDDCADFAFLADPGLAIDELMCAADALVTDYSSVVFEYSLMGRPMIFFAPDFDDYCDWRGFYYDYDEMTPGPVVHTTGDLLEAVSRIPEWFDGAEVDTFRRKFMQACDGHATERICHEVFMDEELERLRKRPALEVLRERDPEGVDVSIVIPAYNAQATLGRALQSIGDQDYDLSRIEVIVVDDCSSDATVEVVECFNQRIDSKSGPHVLLVSTPVQSGSPSEPRNIGITKAQGRYVFFLDSDDWLGPQAVRRMLQHALDWQSDVLVVKLVGENGRTAPSSMFIANDPDADIWRSKIMWTLGPYKLFRRELIADLRFPDFMPEDMSFVLRAYVAADRVSVAADYDYYHLAFAEGEDANISLRSWDDVESNLRAYEDVFGFLADVLPAGIDDRRAIIKRLFGRDIANTIRSIGPEKLHGSNHPLLNIAGPFYDSKLLQELDPETFDLLDSVFATNV